LGKNQGKDFFMAMHAIYEIDEQSKWQGKKGNKTKMKKKRSLLA